MKLLIAYMILVPFKFGFEEETDVKANNYIIAIKREPERNTTNSQVSNHHH